MQSTPSKDLPPPQEALLPWQQRFRDWLYQFAPTPIGMKVWAEAEITAVSENGKMVDFAVKAWDESGPIGSGTHTRAIVKNEKFLAKCNAKLEKK